MTGRRSTITVGIPAYNEEKNIGNLLKTLLSQNDSNYVLQEIIVASDGSSDKTAAIVKKIKDRRVTIIDDGKRRGKSVRLEQIMQKFTSDILIFLDADVTITNKQLLKKIVTKFSLESTGILAVNATPLKAQNFLEGCINHSVKIQQFLRKNWNKGNNYLSFGGRLLVLSHQLAKNVVIPPKMINHDAFLYFEAVRLGFTPAYISNARIYYRSPSRFEDQVKQSMRFRTQQKELNPNKDKVLSKQYSIPKWLFFKSLLLNFFENPVYFISYVFMMFYINSQPQIHVSNAWEVATSTK